MDYETFHDESTPENGGYWHGILFVPTKSKPEIIKIIKKIRSTNGFKDRERLNFKGLNRKGKKFDAISQLLYLFKLIIRTQLNTKLGNMGPIKRKIKFQDPYCKEIEYQELFKVKTLLGVRFVLLKERDSHRKMIGYPDYASKMETTFRFALTGGMHLFFNKNNPINLVAAHFDGHRHLNRRINTARITKGLDKKLRRYCTVDPAFYVDDRHGKDRDSDSFVIMNFIDNIISSWRCLISESFSNDVQKEAVYPIRDLWERWQKSEILKNFRGRWLRSFALSECWLEKDEWKFNNEFGIPDSRSNRLF